MANLLIGVVSLGLQVAKGIKYIDALKDRVDELASIRQEAALLENTLQIIDKRLSHLCNEHLDAVETVQRCLSSCKKPFDDLKALVSELSCSEKSSTFYTASGNATPTSDGDPKAGIREKMKHVGKKSVLPV